MGSSKMAAQPPPYGASAPPPQQGYAPPPQQPVTVQVQHAPAQLVQGQIRFDKHPIAMTCPHCQQSITTTTSTSVGGFALVAGLAPAYHAASMIAWITITAAPAATAYLALT